jgi:hypothetical protein
MQAIGNTNEDGLEFTFRPGMGEAAGSDALLH